MTRQFRSCPGRRWLDTHKYGSTVNSVKTTIELPDELLVAAKKRAAELRRPLRQLVEDGLRRELASSGREPKRKRKRFRWVTSKGGLPPGVDVSDRASMWDWIQKQS
jgi:hypothetical protein